MKKLTTRCIMLLASIAIIISEIFCYGVKANESSKKSEYNGGYYSVVFKVTGEWENGYMGQVILSNIGDQPIKDWRLCFKLDSNIQNIWNANIISRDDNNYIITNNIHNQLIEPGESVEFGFICDNCFSEFPSNYSISCSNYFYFSKNAYSVEYRLESDWNDGFNGSITIKNTSFSPILNWQISFDFDRFIDDIWNAEIIKCYENSYEIDNNGYNSVILPGESIYIGFNGTGGSCEDIPGNFSLKGTGSPEILDTVLIPDGGDDSNINPTENEEFSQLSYDRLIKYYPGESQNSVIHDVYLVTNDYIGISVSWKSGNEDIIHENGAVTRPQKDFEEVKLVAEIIYDNGQQEEKEFVLKVYGYPDYCVEELNNYTLDDIIDLNKNEDVEYQLNESGRLRSFYGKYSDIQVRNIEDAINTFYNVKTLSGVRAPQEELKPISILTSEYGNIYKFKQYYRDIPVYDTIFSVVTDKNGYTTFLLSDYQMVDTNLSINPTFSLTQTISLVEDSIPEASINNENYDDSLYIYVDENGSYLVWRLELSINENKGLVPSGQYEVLVDAITGTIKFFNPLSVDEEDNLSTNMDLEGITRTFLNTAHTSIIGINEYLELKDRTRNIYWKSN